MTRDAEPNSTESQPGKLRGVLRWTSNIVNYVSPEARWAIVGATTAAVVGAAIEPEAPVAAAGSLVLFGAALGIATSAFIKFSRESWGKRFKT